MRECINQVARPVAYHAHNKACILHLLPHCQFMKQGFVTEIQPGMLSDE